MNNSSIIIIGAGISGLAAGCYAQMNGYNSTIFEMHNIPGGLCTSWKRGVYTFDGCLDWLTGSSPDGMFYPLWREVGVIDNCRFINHDSYCDFLDDNGDTVRFYFNPDKLSEELLRHSPKDDKVIGELCDLIRTFYGFKPNVAKAQELFNFVDYLKMMPEMILNLKQYRAFFKYGKITMSELAAKFKSPLLRLLLESIWGGNFPVSLFASTMAWCAAGTAGYPEGGSLKVAKAMEEKYISLGGNIRYDRCVEEIIVEEGKAVGVKLVDGSTNYADYVISAADGYTTLNRMLGGRYSTEKIKKWYGSYPTYPPYIQISLGVARDMINEPKLMHIRLKQPVYAAGAEVPYMILQNYSCDSSLAPEGRTSLAVRIFTDYDYWQNLYSDRKRYRAEKEALTKDIIGAISQIYPGIENEIEALDVATPATYVRYTGTWKGATMSWLPTTANFAKSIDKTLPGLDNFYMTGQWLVPGGGVPNALKTARDTLQMICKRDRKRFLTAKR